MVGEICQFVVFGCQGLNQMKVFMCCGMGLCQGCWCGMMVGELIVDVQQCGVGDVGYYWICVLIKLVIVGEMVDVFELLNDFQCGEFLS